MTELDIMRRAKMYMDKLAMGIDPISNLDLPTNCGLDQTRLSRCFSYVSDVLGRVIANGGNVGEKAPFTITPEQIARVPVSMEPVRVSQLADTITAAADNPGMRKMNTTVITNWLLEKGFLEKQTTPEGKHNRVPTAAGAAMGLFTQTRQGSTGEYQAVLYSPQAQRFVLEHLLEMLGGAPAERNGG